MIAAATIFLLALASLAEGIAWTAHRIWDQREAWPPTRVITTRDTIEETF